MWEEDCLYRHENNSDVAFEIEKISALPDGDWELKVSWWNIGHCHKPWPMTITQNIRIQRDKVKQWIKMNLNELGPALRCKSL
jgi:hypothetical protein